MQQSFSYCEQQVRAADKDRFLATLFAPASRRGPVFALYAFDLEIAQVRDRISTPLPGEVRLQWWRDVLTGTAHGDAGANPVATALLDTVARFALPAPALLDLIDAHTFDLYDEPMATLADLERYADVTSSALIRMAARILDGGIAAHADVIRRAGIVLGVTSVLMQLPLHASRGQLYLPGDVLAKHQLETVDLFAGRTTLALQGALAELRAVVRGHLDAVRAAAPDIPSELLPALLPLALVPATLRRMERPGADPLQPTPVPQWRRQWALWRAAHHPSRFIR